MTAVNSHQMKKKSSFYVVIMAGGTGTRLYPLSRKKSPKQFLNLVSSRSLLQDTFERVKPLAPASNIYISTNNLYRRKVSAQLPQIPPENIICEPAKRNTAPAMGLVASIIRRKNPQAVVLTMASDHALSKPQEFRRAIRAGAWQVQKDNQQIIAIGIKPDSPHTGYGYIKKGEKINSYRGTEIYKVEQFVEKPNLQTAKKYLSHGGYFWNASYFIWHAGHLLGELEKFEPKLARGLKKISASLGKSNFQKICSTQFPLLDEVSIDTAVMEKTKKLAVIPASLGWSDIGSWAQVAQIRAKNKLPLTRGNCLKVQTRNCLIEAKDKLVVAVGVKNLAIVQTEDVILVASLDRSQNVKEVVEKLKHLKKEKYL